MSIEACADLVRRGDPDRFASAMCAPPEKRGRLFVLYAFNLEIARAPWVTQEPMIAEMRLQWWLDALDELEAGKPARAHEVAGPLAALIEAQALPVAVIREMIEARQFDIYKEPHADTAAFDAYLRNTSGHLMWLAAIALGAKADARDVVYEFAYGAGLASLFMAIPALVDAGRLPLVDGRPEAVRLLARRGLDAFGRARKNRKALLHDARAAPLAGWQATTLLKHAAANPGAVLDGALQSSEFHRRMSLLWRSSTGLW